MNYFKSMVSVLFVLDELFLPEVLVLVTATLSIELGFNDVVGLFYFILTQFVTKVKFSKNTCGRRGFVTSKNSLSAKNAVCSWALINNSHY